MLKSAGYDHIVITGTAKRPSYLLITDEGIRVCEADQFWGKRDIYETIDALAERHGKGAIEAGVLAIGAAGENKVLISNAIVDGSSTLGKNLTGPIMGSKNLKAIVTYGTGGVTVHDDKRFLRAVKAVSMGISKWRETTSPFFYEGPAAVRGMSDEYRESYSEDQYRKTLRGFKACTSCPSACRAEFEIRDGRFKGESMKTSHWLVLPNYGQRLRLKDYRETMVLVDSINRKGLDLFSTVQLITFVTRLFEHGEISSTETDGLELSRNFDCYMNLVEMIANREGFGEVLANGWHAVSQKLGVDAFQHHDAPALIKGSDANVDARSWTLRPASFSEVVNPRGGYFHVTTPIWIHHPGAIPFNKAKHGFQELLGLTREERERIFPSKGWNIARLNKHCEDILSVFNCLGICSLYHTCGSGAMTIQLMNELYSAATGIERTTQELKEVGERVWNLFKLINVKEGFSRKDDTWPALWEKSTETPARTQSGPLFLKDYYGNSIQKEELQRLLDDYYDERGWDIDSGIPTSAKLKELDLEGLV
jgi:aldehyde:ferredoxin oxidoreductase